ncbi:phosphotransferase family protein [Streptomyces sp. NBC_01497]|uniref:phosphotransferase family protein n=1 Tax=Streptomyces sp. NBC_01497 TaxID=2903885 RepID=UPI002E2EBEE4|nr:aminoglycoside phosphotransferase family protein [Streptomyces sp. NBC_01497]
MVWSTHTVEADGERVVKTFRPGDHAEHAREWRALCLLHIHAPGLAPVPLASDPAVERPVIVMSRLPGTPLRGALADPARTAALARAVRRLHTCVPPGAVRSLPPRPDRASALLRRVPGWLAEGHADRTRGVAAQAVERGISWLGSSRVGEDDPPGVPVVFGPGDGNLANYLWDGQRVRAVDFEDSGRSDRAFELAEITEHVSSREEGGLDVPLFLGHFPLTRAEAARYDDCRRLLSLVWLFLLLGDASGPGSRNPPGAAEHRAAHLLRLLDGANV